MGLSPTNLLSKISSKGNEALVVALGNPGEKYHYTRHNAGWLILDAAYPDLVWNKNNYAEALESRFALSSDTHITFIKPATFMNESGQSVAWYARRDALPTDRLIVIHDDIDLPIGTLKISFARGDGGHNGIKSITQALRSPNYVRIRVGISYPGNLPGQIHKPAVLGVFSEEDRRTIHELGGHVRKQIEAILTDGVESAASTLNRKS